MIWPLGTQCLSYMYNIRRVAVHTIPHNIDKKTTLKNCLRDLEKKPHARHKINNKHHTDGYITKIKKKKKNFSILLYQKINIKFPSFYYDQSIILT